jgi:hypothetical protein
MNYDLLVFLLCAEFSIIVVLAIFLSRKRKVVIENENTDSIMEDKPINIILYKAA